VWPAVAVAGLAFAVPQFLVSNFHGPWLVDVIAAVCSLVATIAFLRVWRPADAPARVDAEPLARDDVVRALLPWAVLTVLVFAWGTPQVKHALDALSAPKLAVPGLDKLVLRAPPVVAAPTAEAAVFTLNWLSATGTAILVAAIVSGLALRYSLGEIVRVYGRTVWLVRHSLLTIAAMLALGYTSRYAGLDAILGLAFARTGALYPFFGALLGWLGVALTGSDTSSNVLFGNLQTITARQIGVSPLLMAATNSTGGVMGKMLDAQSIVVASTATRWYGHEGRILRFVFVHSLALVTLVGILVMLEAYVAPFTRLVVR
jgi:lactate permease